MVADVKIIYFSGMLARVGCMVITGLLVSFTFTIEAAIYKWIDEKGVVNYSEAPPEGNKVQELKPKPLSTYTPPSPSGLLDTSSIDTLDEEEIYARPSVPLSKLGTLPRNVVSEFLETLNSGFIIDTDKRQPRYQLRLRKTAKLPYDALLEVQFENPLYQKKPVVLTERWPSGKSEISITSPPLTGLKCANYPVTIFIYASDEKTRLLGTHKQHVQSRINLERIETTDELLKAMVNGMCP